jgi:hypothetical protein
VSFSSKPINVRGLALLVLVWSTSALGAPVSPGPLGQVVMGGGGLFPPAAATLTLAISQGAREQLARAPAAHKIASPVQRVVQRMRQDGVTVHNVTARHPERYSTSLVRVDTAGRVHTVILVTMFDAQVESTLSAQQVAIERVEPQAGLVQGWIPFDRLETVAALPFVRFLRAPSYAARR